MLQKENRVSRKTNLSAISYTLVANACAELIQQGDRLNIRKVRERLGARSFSTLNPLYHRWQDEQRLSQKVEADLSDAFRQAVLAEIGRATATLEKKCLKMSDLKKNAYASLKACFWHVKPKSKNLKRILSFTKKPENKNAWN